MLKKTIYLLLFIVLTHTITAQSNRMGTAINNINNKIKQADTTIENLHKMSNKFANQIDSKIDTYKNRITGKTEKTLTKLVKWENKIKTLLQKVNPEAANNLFKPGQITFSLILQKLKEGEEIVTKQKNHYNQYIDELNTKFSYIQTQKSDIDSNLVKKLQNSQTALQELSKKENQKEILVQLIKERKKVLLEQAFKILGNNKYFNKINKETYYYVETLKNYKQIFNDPKKAESFLRTTLNNIPAFQKFFKEHSELASLFGITSVNDYSGISLAGLQTRANVQADIQQRLGGAGPNAQALFSQSMQDAQAKLNGIKTDLLNKFKAAETNKDNPEGMKTFKPNSQKTKTFLQRIEYSTNLQFGKSNSLLPTAADVGFSVGYKLNDKSIIGIGGSYKLGLGSIQKIEFSNQGASVRSFVDWKIKKQFFLSGGFEMNLIPDVNATTTLPKNNATIWQQSGLIGISKKLSIKSKYFKSTQLKLLHDFLYKQHSPISQPIVFRVGYNF